MKCTNCGFETEQDFAFCSKCGTPAPAPAPEIKDVAVNSVATRFLPILKDGMFLAICILMTAATAFAIIGEGLPVINILFTIFLWLTYAKAREGVVDSTQLRNISGTVYANYVIFNVVSGILIVCGMIIAFAFQIVSKSTELTAEFIEGIELNVPQYIQFEEEIYSIFGIVLGVFFIIVGAVFLIINLLGMRKIHRFAKSVYIAVETGNPYFENPIAVRNWLVFFSVCSVISALSAMGESIVGAISTGCSAATIILATIMIKKYFLYNPNNNQ